MSHDRACFKCWREPWEWRTCDQRDCVKKDRPPATDEQRKLTKNEVLRRVTKT